MSKYTPGNGTRNTLPKREVQRIASEEIGFTLDKKGAEVTQGQVDELTELLLSSKYDQNPREVERFFQRMNLTIVEAPVAEITTSMTPDAAQIEQDEVQPTEQAEVQCAEVTAEVVPEATPGKDESKLPPVNQSVPVNSSTTPEKPATATISVKTANSWGTVFSTAAWFALALVICIGLYFGITQSNVNATPDSGDKPAVLESNAEKKVDATAQTEDFFVPPIPADRTDDLQ